MRLPLTTLSPVPKKLIAVRPMREYLVARAAAKFPCSSFRCENFEMLEEGITPFKNIFAGQEKTTTGLVWLLLPRSMVFDMP